MFEKLSSVLVVGGKGQVFPELAKKWNFAVSDSTGKWNQPIFFWNQWRWAGFSEKSIQIVEKVRDDFQDEILERKTDSGASDMFGE